MSGWFSLRKALRLYGILSQWNEQGFHQGQSHSSLASYLVLKKFQVVKGWFTVRAGQLHSYQVIRISIRN